MFPAIALAASFSIAWIYVLVFVPRQVESIFRHRLWRVRDELLDHIFDGDMSDVEGAESIIAVLEAVIQHSREINLARYLAFKIPRQTVQAKTIFPFESSRLLPSEREILRSLLDEFYRSSMFKIYASSRLGVWLLPVWFIRYRRRSEPLAEPQTELRRLRRVQRIIENRERPTGDLLANAV